MSVDPLADTPVGPGRLLPDAAPPDPRAVLVVGHGAGGQGWPASVRALVEVAAGSGVRVVRVDQPWRVAGRKVASRPPMLDQAWPALVAAAHALAGPDLPLLVGGHSAGARVACRTAHQVDAVGVLALSFPLHLPGRPERSRAEEALEPGRHGIRLEVVQGRSDAFGTAAEVQGALGGAHGGIRVWEVPGPHAPRDSAALRTALAGALSALLAPLPRPAE